MFKWVHCTDTDASNYCEVISNKMTNCTLLQQPLSPSNCQSKQLQIQLLFLYQVVNIIISAVMLSILMWKRAAIYFVASSGD